MAAWLLLLRCLAIAAPPTADAQRLRDQAAAAYARRDLVSAEQLWRQALVAAEQLTPESPLVAYVADGLAGVRFSLGYCEEAEELWHRAVDVGRRLVPGQQVVVNATNGLGVVAIVRGDLTEAADLLQQALAMAERLQPAGLALCPMLQNLGNIACQRGDQEAARGYFERALDILERLAPGDDLSIAGCLASLGTLAMHLGDLDTAEQNYRRALRLFEQRAPDSLECAACLNNLGNVASLRGDAAEARPLFVDYVTRLERLAPGSLSLGLGLFNLGLATRTLGDLPAARALYEQALAIEDRLAPDSVQMAEQLPAVAWLCLLQGDVEAARRYARRAVAVLEAQRDQVLGTEARALLMQRLGGPYLSLIAAELAAGDPAAALAALERSRSRSLVEAIQERDLDLEDAIPAALRRRRDRLAGELAAAHAELARLSLAGDADRVSELGRTMADLGSAQRELTAAIRGAIPRYAALRYPEPLDGAGIQASLDPGTVLLAYSIGYEASHLFAVTRETLEVHDLDIDFDMLIAELAEFGEACANPRGRPDALGGSLYDRLVRPAEEMVQRSERVLVLPDSDLYTTPFAALVTSSPGEPARYLIEAKPLHQIASMTLYRQLREAAPADADEVVVLGDPAPPEAGALADGPIDPAAALTALPYARLEAETVGDLFGPAARVLVGAQASERAAKTVLANARVVHFACHGLCLADHPLDSTLVLAPGEGEDGLLQAWEIIRDVSLHADLVVLSACESGSGGVQIREGLVGLSRAFQYAGARTVAASLWRVADEAGVEVMTRLHQLRREGSATDEALRAAQLELLEAGRRGNRIGGRPTSHPFFWATYTINGDWR